MLSRKLTGTVYNLQGRPWPDLRVQCELVPLSIGEGVWLPGEGISVPQGRFDTNTNSRGHFEADLWVGDFSLSPYYYRLHLPGEEIAFYFLPGAPIDLEEIRRMAETVVTPQTAGQIYDQLLVRVQKDIEAVVDARIKAIAGDKTYIHDENYDISSLKWTVIHDLGKFPSVAIVDRAGEQIDGTVRYLDENSLEIEFNSLMKGKAYCN